MQQYCHSKTGLKAGAQLGSCAARKRHTQQCQLLVNVCGKTGQLLLVVSSFFSEAAGKEQEPLHKRGQKLAAWTSFPLTEGEPVQSANICFLCCHLHMHSSATDLPVHKILPEYVAFAFMTLTNPN